MILQNPLKTPLMSWRIKVRILKREATKWIDMFSLGLSLFWIKGGQNAQRQERRNVSRKEGCEGRRKGEGVGNEESFEELLNHLGWRRAHQTWQQATGWAGSDWQQATWWSGSVLATSDSSWWTVLFFPWHLHNWNICQLYRLIIGVPDRKESTYSD